MLKTIRMKHEAAQSNAAEIRQCLDSLENTCEDQRRFVLILNEYFGAK